MSVLAVLLPKKIEGATSDTWSKVLAWGAGLVACGIFAPFIWSIVTGVYGFLLGLITVWASLKLAPAFGIFVGNLSLKLIKYQARQNPIETMERNFQANDKKIISSENLALEYSKQVEGFRGMVEDLKKNFPADAAPFLNQLKVREETRERLYSAIKRAKAEQAEFRTQIKRATAIWEATKYDEKISIFARGLGKTDAIAQIEADEAIRAIQQRVANSFATLDDLNRSLQSDDLPLVPEVRGNAQLMPPTQLVEEFNPVTNTSVYTPSKRD